MNQTEFLEALGEVSDRFSWEYTNNRVTGRNRGRVFNPVTAVAFSRRLGYFENNRRGTLTAARQLGLSTGVANAVYSTSNRGHAQIVRGKVLNVLDY